MVAIGIFAVGGLYWVIWTIVLPYFGRYVLVKDIVVDVDGWSRSVYTHVPVASTERS